MGMSTTAGACKHVGAGEAWTVTDASELYEIDRWGKGYFSVGAQRSRPGPPDQGPVASPST